jgi:hypothetical protein
VAFEQYLTKKPTVYPHYPVEHYLTKNPTMYPHYPVKQYLTKNPTMYHHYPVKQYLCKIFFYMIVMIHGGLLCKIVLQGSEDTQWHSL